LNGNPSVGIQVDTAFVGLHCYAHKDYPADASADYALCFADTDIQISEYETINTSRNVLRANGEVLLTGVGCLDAKGTDSHYGALYEGEARIFSLPDQSNSSPELKHFIVARGDAALCRGDSGGATYFFLDAAKQSRILVGVNSSSYLKDPKYGSDKDKSFAAATSSKIFLNWALNEWPHHGDALICGLHPHVKSCHP
jgi:hypothetical protein